jgi:NADH-quinone oxidoreductase subunit M
MYQRVIFGPLVHEENKRLVDLRPREILVLGPVIALCVLMGVYPKPFLVRIEPSVERMLARVATPAGAGHVVASSRLP